MDLIHLNAMSHVGLNGYQNLSGPQRPDDHVEGGEHIVALLGLPNVTGVVVLRGEPTDEGRWPGGLLYRELGER